MKGSSTEQTKKPVSLPLITIGLTCFNAADTISRAVASALWQDWPNKEILVVDDASRDTSGAVLKTLAQDHPGVRIIRHRVNTGLSGSLNTIMREARGEFVALFDDDDESIPERLKTQWNRIISYEKAKQCKLILCYSNRNVVKKGKSGPNWIAKAIGREAPEPHGIAVADYIFGHVWDRSAIWGMFGSCTLMARRETFLSIGPFDEKFRRCAEWDLAIRAAFRGAHFIAVNQPLVTQYRTDGVDKSATMSLQYALHLREKHKSYLSDRGLYRASRAMARAQFHGGMGRLWVSRAYALIAYSLSPTLSWQKLVSRIRGPKRGLRFLGRGRSRR
jgi:glycosyltransferase involved in cell wall biosynthesis